MGSVSLARYGSVPSSLSSLPNELLVQIFESISTTYSERCIYFSAVSRINRHFHSIITPMLYRKFDDCCAKHLKLFGRTVLSNEDRAELVKHYEGRRDALMFDSPEIGCPMVWNDFVLDQDLVEAVTKRLPNLPTSMTRATFSHALASTLPRLHRLDVTNCGNQLIRHLADSRLHGRVSFQQLCTLSVATEPDRTYPMHDISLLFTLPSLRTLFIDMAALKEEEEQGGGEAIDCSHWKCQPQSSTIQELTLERCGLPAPWIAKMIGSCRTLRSFHHEHYYWDTDADYFTHIFHALKFHQDTLSDVRINELNGCKVVSARQADPIRPMSFQHFTSLTHLDVPLFLFCTRTQHCSIDKLLPRSLQVLTLDLRSAREGPSDTFFISVAEAAQDSLPELKSVEVVCRIEVYQEDGFLPLHFCHLRRMLSTRGIELIYLLEFVQCEFKAGNKSPCRSHFSLLTSLQPIWSLSFQPSDRPAPMAVTWQIAARSKQAALARPTPSWAVTVARQVRIDQRRTGAICNPGLDQRSLSYEFDIPLPRQGWQHAHRY
jgi:hypothetical protein